MSAALALVAVAAAAPGRADDRPSMAATRALAPLRIDGVLDEPDWLRAGATSDFRLLLAREGEVPSESTSVRVLFEAKRIVFGIECQSRLRPHAGLSPRDQIDYGDHVAVHLDPDGDGRHAYLFGVNPWGVQLDGVLLEEPDFTWDGVWESAVHRDSARWSAEIAVPFRVMRFRDGARAPWRIWVRRELAARNEVASWPLWRQGSAGNVMLQAAELTGLAGVRGGHSVFVEPYVSAALDGARTFGDDGTVGAWDDVRRRDAGVDAQAALTSALALNATWRPDFSQIESDALKLDLNRRFPLQYPEKRPFFLEGADVFRGPLELVYTRRMASPRAGLKLAGRAGATRVGALLVRDEGGASLAGSGFGDDADSRLGWFGLGRAARDFGAGNSIGVMAGVHTQDANEDGIAFPTGTREYAAPQGTANGFAAADGALRLGERWSWEGQFGLTATRLDTISSERGNVHDSFRGPIVVSRINYVSRDWSVRTGMRVVGRRFRDELGYQERTGVRIEHAVTTRHWDRASGALQRIDGNTDVYVVHDLAGAVAFSQVNPWLDVQWRRNFTFSPGAEFADEEWRGRHYHQERAHVFVKDARAEALTWDLEAIVGDGIAYGEDDASSFLAWSETWIGNVSLRPAPRWASGLNVQRLRVARRWNQRAGLSQWLVGLNSHLQLSPLWSLRIYPQYDSDARHLAVNGLLAWRLHPGTALYLGTNAGYDRVANAPRPHWTGRQVFLKASYRAEP